MTNALTTFDFNSNQIRVVTIDGQPWFAAGDVCEVLGFAKHPTNKTYSHHLSNRVAADERRTHMLPTIVAGRNSERKQLIISESGLYKLIMRSDKAEAR